MAVIAQKDGQIAAALERIYRMVDEPSIRTKFPQNAVLDLLNECWTETLTDLYNQAENVPLARYDVTLVSGQDRYLLPANCGEIVRVCKRDDPTGLVLWEMPIRGLLNPYGYGVRFEGTQHMIVNPTPTGTTETISVEYIPAGDVTLFVGLVPKASTSLTTVDLSAATAKYGVMDRRPNAYTGCYLSLLKATEVTDTGDDTPATFSVFPIQERIITAVSYGVPVRATIAPAFSFNPSAMAAPTTYIKFELYPIEAPLIWPCVCYNAAMKLAAIEKKTNHYRLLLDLYNRSKRATALRWANAQSRGGHAMQTDTPDNPEYGSAW